MKTLQAVAGLCLVLGAPLALADAGGFGVGGPQSYIWAEVAMNRAKMAMGVADKNKDGMLSKEEFMAFADMNAGKQMMMMDMNNDGMVSADEWTSSNLHPSSTFYGDFR